MDAGVKILGLAGQQGAGKDYICDKIQRHMTPNGFRRMESPHVVLRMAFADILRGEIEDILQMDERHTVWEKPYPAEVRWLLQQWGTELRRSQDLDYWVKKALDKMNTYPQPPNLWVITDVRFPNEQKLIEDAGGIVANVIASDENRADRLGISQHELTLRSQHASEQVLMTEHYVTNNDVPFYSTGIKNYLPEFYLP